MEEPDRDATASLAPQKASVRGEFRPGSRLADRYVIVQFVGHGGMGDVYEAIDEHLQGKRIAIKTLRSEIAGDPEMRERFEREVLVAREVSHRAVCPTWDLIRATGPHGPILCLSMKLLRGESLWARLHRSGPMTPETALPLARQMAAGLDAAHAAGVIHRDFKAANVILEGQDAGTTATITDFGLSRMYDSDKTIGGVGQIAGTHGYMAPELFTGRTASPASDVYAFGVVLYELLTGKRPLERKGGPDLSKLSVPEAWKHAIAGCLEEDPHERFQSAGEAMALLESPETKRHVAVQLRKSRARRAIPYILMGCVLLAGALTWLMPRMDALVHPLPEHRFVALSSGRESVPGQAAMLGSVLDKVHDRLVRAESREKNLLVIGSAELAQQKDDPAAMGANLRLRVSVGEAARSLRVQLDDLISGKTLRTEVVPINRTQPGGTPEAVAAVAAKMLRVPAYQERLKDEDELAGLPASVYELFTGAEELRRQPNDAGLDAAIEKYQRVLEAEPRFALGYAKIAQAYTRKYQLGHDASLLAVARTNAELALQHNPESPAAVVSAGLIDLYSGQTSEALNAFAKVLRLDPDNPDVRLYQGAAYRDLNRLPDEEKICRLVIRQRPNFYRAYNALGMALYRQSKYAESAEAFRQATKVAPRQALPFTNLGMAYLLVGRREEAGAAFHASLERGPSELAWMNLGIIAFQDGDYRRALEGFERARDLKPSDDLAWRNIADCYAVLHNRKAMLENYEKAASLLGDLMKTNPKGGSRWMTLAFYYAKLGRREDADGALASGEAAGASSVQAQFTKAQALAVLGRKAEASGILAECVRRGLAPIEIQLALDLKGIREDPAWMRRNGEKKKESLK